MALFASDQINNIGLCTRECVSNNKDATDSKTFKGGAVNKVFTDITFLPQCRGNRKRMLDLEIRLKG